MEKPGFRFCLTYGGKVYAGGDSGYFCQIGAKGELCAIQETCFESQLHSQGDISYCVTEDLTCGFLFAGKPLIAGALGGLYTLREGMLCKDGQIAGKAVALCSLKERLAVVTAEGKVYWGEHPASLSLSPPDGGQAVCTQENPVIGVACGRGKLLMLTAGGSLFATADFCQWEHREFLEDYRGYYPACRFTALSFEEGMFFAAGLDGAGEPVLFESLYGGVWKQRPLDSVAYGTVRLSARQRINAIASDPDSGQVFLLCNSGEIVVMSGCPKCMKLAVPVQWDLAAGTMFDGKLYLVGSGFQAVTVDFDRLRQLKVGAAHARELVQGGALLIDLRGEREYAALHIKGSINVPLEKLPVFLDGLERLHPLIFTCASGALSAEACSVALERGFSRVYDLGGLGEWGREYPEDL